jgi:hypothetical protein
MEQEFYGVSNTDSNNFNMTFKQKKLKDQTDKLLIKAFAEVPSLGAKKAKDNFYKAILSVIDEAERKKTKEIIKLVQTNQLGTFTDDGGDDCWYIKDLVNKLKGLVKE